MHDFVKSSFSEIDKPICAVCRRSEIDHSDSANCEACSNVGKCQLLNGILLCASCYEKELPLYQNKGKVLQFDKQIEESVKLDQSIQYSGDFFNSEVKSIEELRAMVQSDESVANDQKHYHFMNLLKERFTQFKNKIIANDRENQELRSRQKALQKNIADYVQQLKAEEKTRFKEFDLNYKPTEKVIKDVKVKVSKEDKLIDNYIRLTEVCQCNHGMAYHHLGKCSRCDCTAYYSTKPISRESAKRFLEL